MPPYVYNGLVAVPPHQWYEPMTGGMLGRSAPTKKQNEHSQVHLATVRFHDKRQVAFGSHFPHEWLKSLSPSLKMDLVSDFLAWLWEPEPSDYHRETLHQIGMDLMASFSVCDFSLLVAVGYLLRLKLVFDRAEIHTRDCSAQLFTVALLAAVKFIYDVPPSNADWADISHFERRRLNQMEFELLEALDFNLYASMKDASAALEEIMDRRRSEVESARVAQMTAHQLAASSWYMHQKEVSVPGSNTSLLDSFGDYEPWSDPAGGCGVSYGPSRAQSPLAAVPHQQDHADEGFSLFHHALMAPAVPDEPEDSQVYGAIAAPEFSDSRHHIGGGGYGYPIPRIQFPAAYPGFRLQAGRGLAGYPTPAASVQYAHHPAAHHLAGRPVYDCWLPSDSLFATATF